MEGFDTLCPCTTAFGIEDTLRPGGGLRPAENLERFYLVGELV